MDGDDSDRPRQHSYSISPARSLLQPLTITIGRQEWSMVAAGAGATGSGSGLRPTDQPIDVPICKLDL